MPTFYAYMHKVAFYRGHSGLEDSPALIYFDIDENRRDIKFTLRLPKKTASNVAEHGNPWDPSWSDKSKEAVLA